MITSENQIKNIVEQVLKNIKVKNVPVQSTSSYSGDGIFNSMEDAVLAAKEAFYKYTSVSLETRIKIIETMREAAAFNAEKWARMAQEETGMGRVADKIAKNNLVIAKTPGPEILVPEVQTGDRGLTLTERAPYGLIAAITPSTNPAATIINNSISFLSGGNSVVYNFHPAAKNVCADAVRVLNKAAVSVGAPNNLMTAVAIPTIETGMTMMKHKEVRLVVVTGGPAVVDAAFGCGKKVICAGPGNPPVLVDETADLDLAAKNVILGASFDNNLLCIAEKELFVVSSVADQLKDKMSKYGAQVLRPDQTKQLMEVILTPEGYPDKKWVGKDAALILKEIGINVDDSVRLVVSETDVNHPFVQHELLMPVLPLVRVRDVDQGIEYSIKSEHGFGHTATMYSRNIENLHKMACMINTSIFVKNGPSVSGLGFEGEGSTTMTIASPTGEGCTDARTFTRLRRCVLKDYFRIV